MRKTVKIIALALLACVMVASSASAADLYACVAIFDVKPGFKAQFQNELLAQSQTVAGAPGYVVERVLRNIDPYSNQFALYSRASTLEMAKNRCQPGLAGLASLLERPAETHLAKVDNAYNQSGRITDPLGLEFGAGEVGQIAHLGLFVPFEIHRAEYDRILDLVKMNTVERENTGYMGEDILTEVEPASVEVQNPYTPRPEELVPMSINYGEYTSLENAENAYVLRGQDQTGDARIRYWYRAFFGALQVPHRFYIFEVIGNNPNETHLAKLRQELATTVAGLEQ